MTGTAIPELVARLRELHNARRYPTEMLVATIRDDQSAQVYATSTGPMRGVRPVAETTVDHADLIAETLNALPAILDALDHVGDSNKMVDRSPDGGKAGARSNWSREGLYWLLRYGEKNGGGWDDECAEGEWLPGCDDADAIVDAADRIAHLESLTTWRPISEPPSAEVHAWCGGEYTVRSREHGHHVLQFGSRLSDIRFPEWVEAWLPIPPSAEGSEEE